MKIEQIQDLKKGQIFNCSECGKKLLFPDDGIHFMGVSVDFIGFDEGDEGVKELNPVCESCHNEVFGSDIDDDFPNRDFKHFKNIKVIDSN